MKLSHRAVVVAVVVALAPAAAACVPGDTDVTNICTVSCSGGGSYPKSGGSKSGKSGSGSKSGGSGSGSRSGR